MFRRTDMKLKFEKVFKACFFLFSDGNLFAYDCQIWQLYNQFFLLFNMNLSEHNKNACKLLNCYCKTISVKKQQQTRGSTSSPEFSLCIGQKQQLILHLTNLYDFDLNHSHKVAVAVHLIEA